MDLGWDIAADRQGAHERSKDNAVKVHGYLTKRMTPDLAAQLGLASELGPRGIDRGSGMCECVPGDSPEDPFRFEVHSVRPARRVAPNGSFVTDLVVVLTQRRCAPLWDGEANDGFWFRGGCTLLIDTRRGRERVRYCITKNVRSDARRDRQRAFMTGQSSGSLARLYFGAEGREPFAALHRGR
jgi:hypothetical protein